MVRLLFSKQSFCYWSSIIPKAKVSFSDRKLWVKKPRLRRKGHGARREVEIPAYEARNNDVNYPWFMVSRHSVSWSPRVLSILAKIQKFVKQFENCANFYKFGVKKFIYTQNDSYS